MCKSFTHKVCIMCKFPIVFCEDHLRMFDLERLEVHILRIDFVELLKLLIIFLPAMYLMYISSRVMLPAMKLVVIDINLMYVMFTKNLSFIDLIVLCMPGTFYPVLCFHINTIAIFERNLCIINWFDFI